MTNKKWMVRISILIVLYYAWFGIKHQTYSNGQIQVGDIICLSGFLTVHSSFDKYITVRGKTYPGVRGNAPYYLDVPEIHSILFVTEKNFDIKNTCFHFLDLSNEEITDIPLPGVNFGSRIGFHSAEPTWMNSVEFRGKTNFVAISRVLGRKDFYHIDLIEKKLTYIEVQNLDDQGHIIGQKTISR